LKARGVVTGAAVKRNPLVRENIALISSWRQAENIASVGGPFAAVVVPPAQFVHQLFEVGGQVQGFGTQVLLQPLAHAIADRSAGLVIDLFALVGDSADHPEFPPDVGPFAVLPNQSTAAEIVPVKGDGVPVCLKFA
jgi:hypothetical protein